MQKPHQKIFEKTIQAIGLKLGSYVTLLSFYKLISGPKMGLKMYQNQS